MNSKLVPKKKRIKIKKTGESSLANEIIMGSGVKEGKAQMCNRKIGRCCEENRSL